MLNQTPNMATKEINNHWGNVEIKDATSDLTFAITQEDIDSSIPNDPAQCSMAQAVKRACQAPQALVWRTTTYIRMSENSVLRFTNSQKLKEKVIYPLDKGDIPEKGFYTLKAPSRSEKLGEPSKRKKALELRRANGLAPEKQSKDYAPRRLVTSRLLKIFLTKE